MKLAIIADDFTGSNDTGVQFAKKGLHTMVTTAIDNIQLDQIPEVEVLVCDTESRFNSTDTAYTKNFNVTQQLRNSGTDIFYKKIDSTFRGNIGSELAGVMDGSGINVMFLIPALPSNGRITRDGNVIVNGVYLHETETARDPRTPVKISYIPDIIKEQCEKKVLSLALQKIPTDQREFNEFIRSKHFEGIEIFVFDAEDIDQLRTLSNLVCSYAGECIFAGTAGFAEFLPDVIKLKKEKPVLAVVGSISEVSRSQIDFVLGKGTVDLVPFDIRSITNPLLMKEAVNMVCCKLSEGSNVVLSSAYYPRDIEGEKKQAEQMNISMDEFSDRIARVLGTCTVEILEKAGKDISGLFITGGDTLIKIAEQLGTPGMTITEEVLPAIPCGFFVHESFSSIKVLTKAGSFGAEDALEKIISYLRRNA